MTKTATQPEGAPYDALYCSKPDHILWGASPGRLMPLLIGLSNGRTVFDAGCGDGRNALFLEQRGFVVTGCDVSALALDGLRNRFGKSQWFPTGTYERMNLLRNVPEGGFDVLVSYGLFHCLPPRQREEAHLRLQSKVALNGLLVFSTLTDRIPLPIDHGTEGVVLTAPHELEVLFAGWHIEYREENLITETHLPLVGEHQHAGVWVVARRIK